MQDSLLAYSFSAPKILGTCNSPIFTFSPGKFSPQISPGESPSCFAIKNFPIEHSGNSKNRNFFFNSAVSLNELKKLADIPTIEEEDENQLSSFKLDSKIISKSVSKKAASSPILNFLLKKRDDSKEEEKKIEFYKKRIQNSLKFVPITVNEIILQRPPARPGNIKRQKRGTFNDEMISFSRYTGQLKFYNLQKRFGFIKVDNEDFDVFICEDDMLLSGQNLRKFKDDVYKKHSVGFAFNIKKYMNNGVEKMKAVMIEAKNL